MFKDTSLNSVPKLQITLLRLSDIPVDFDKSNFDLEFVSMILFNSLEMSLLLPYIGCSKKFDCKFK